MLATLFVTSGATCAKRRPLKNEFLPPVVFESTPTLQELAEQVNHSLQIQRLGSNTLTISSPEITTKLSGTFTWERPHNFTLEAYPGTRAFGVVLAAGSNPDMFWLQTQYPSPPTIYFARHNDFEGMPGPRMVLPVSPLWLREALGVVEFDPQGVHEQPRLRADGKLEVASYIPAPRGAYKRVLVMSPKTATIEQTRLHDHTGKLVAIAQQSDHQYYSAIDWSLPHNVIVQLHPDSGPSMSFTIEVGRFMLNADASSAQFSPPDATGLSTVNLAEINGQPAAVATRPNYRTANTPLGTWDGTRGNFR
jgi:hypothetical protein